jgi:hypothetical protein
MAKTELTDIKKIALDLHNFRTTPQKSEQEAINAMIIVKPDKFIGLINSLIEDGYLATDNIILLKSGSDLIVKEGNRRIAILKIIHGQYNVDEFNLPQNVINNIKGVTAAWKKENRKVPCAIFEASEANLVDKIVNLSHGKGEKASRDQWTSVARARHNRDSNKASEPSLDMLEKYLSLGKNITASQRELWAGDYNLSVLDEALKKILPRLEVSNIAELVTKYPKNKYWLELEDLIRAIGLAQLTFTKIRDKNSDFGTEYGINPIVPTVPATSVQAQPTATTPANPSGNASLPAGTSSPGWTFQPPATSGTTPAAIGVSVNGAATPTTAAAPRTSPSYSTNDPKHVANLLKKFSPAGLNRSKVVTIREEMKKLKISDNPIAFCFLLRSIFEISGKIYCTENGLSLTKGGGKEKTLVEVLSTVTTHLTNGNTDLSKVRSLHGALTELSKPTGILSVTSLNQLVHNTSFTISSTDVCILFGNVYFLLEAMN